MPSKIKAKLYELGVFVTLLLISFVGHYFLSWHLIAGGIQIHLLRAAWMLTMLAIGYWGLQWQQIPWVKYLWLIVYSVLFIALIGDRIMMIYYHYVGNIPSSAFTSPIPYLVACFLPDIVKKQISNSR